MQAKQSTDTERGLGDIHYGIAVYIAHQPEMACSFDLQTVKPLAKGDIDDLVRLNGNHWRKIFNIFAKIMFGLNPQGHQTWQAYRDEALLHSQSGQAILFSRLSISDHESKPIRLISGKTYAEQLNVLKECEDIGDGFFVNTSLNVFVTPYFDYRQLSNQKINRLVELIDDTRSKTKQ